MQQYRSYRDLFALVLLVSRRKMYTVAYFNISKELVMSGKPTRRDFLKTSAAVIGAGTVLSNNPLQAATGGKSQMVCISSANGFLPKQNGGAVTIAMDALKAGSSTMDAVIAGVNTVENDPNDSSVGYGGLPNEEGIVELDSSVMDGPTYGAGAVGSIRNIKNPSLVARLVMERTDHVMIVGDGARRFAVAHGLKEENLLTEESRQTWMRWKETLNTRDNYFPEGQSSKSEPPVGHTGTINCLAVNEAGDISGVTTTSGLSWKIPGRVGDSPIIGAGLYVDNNVGAAGSTGRGEEAIKACGAFHTVMQMANGLSPTDACLATMKRIADSYHNDMKFLSSFNIKFYAVNKHGEYGSASLWEGWKFAVATADKAGHEDQAGYFKREQWVKSEKFRLYRY
jgi:N4-(beta-N-acetylglucosaminyl)-L-asparaginase